MKTILIESSYAFAIEKRGIGSQLFNWLKNIDYQKYPHLTFILTYFEGKCPFNHLPANVKIYKINKVKNFDNYIEKIYQELDFDLIFLQRADIRFWRKNIKTVAVDYGMEQFYCRNYVAKTPVINLLKAHQQALKYYDCIITVSKTSLQDLTWFYPEYSNKIRLIYPGINFSVDKNLLTKNYFKNKSIKKNQYFLVFGYEKKKNIERIATAFNLFKQTTNSKLKLIIVGQSGFGAEEIDKKIHLLKFQSDIIKLGYINDKEKFWLLKNCHSLLAISIYEGFGISALEGLFFDKKVLVSDNGSLKEIVGQAGFLTSPFQVETIKKQMIKISQLKNNPKKKFIKSRLKIYDQKKSANQLIKIFLDLL
jgi:glycosyltransferase involved in cell wall biosynthesis